MEKLELQKIANEVRKDIVTAVHAAKAGHPGGSLSAADVFTYLYFEEMNIDPKDPKKADRDRFVLSKGHTAPGLYSVLAERGYFPKEDLKTLRHLGSYLQEITDRSINSSAVFFYTSSVHNTDLRAIIHKDITVTHFYCCIWNIKILLKFQISICGINLHSVGGIFTSVFKYQPDQVIVIEGTYNFLIHRNCLTLLRNLSAAV